MIRNILIFATLTLVTSAYAAEPILLKSATVWAGVGTGTNTIGDPAKVVDSDGFGFLEAGGNAQLLGPFYVTIGGTWGVSSGKLDYDYTDPVHTHYTPNALPYSTTSTDVRAGLQLRFVDSPSFHFYVEGGGFMRIWSITYETSKDTNLASTGSTYEKEQKNIKGQGSYVEAGLDVLAAGWGVRVAGRAVDGGTELIDATKDKRWMFRDGVGYVALVKEFGKSGK